MCGFLTEFSYHHHIISDKEYFKSILELSKHRGPDDSSIISTDFFQLGFNRLAILDLSENGRQPMYSPSKRYSVVFNGEIYNYKLLAESYNLENLESTSDTEIIVRLCDKLGVEETIKNLNGMFALTIVDLQLQQLFISRDFAGIKPLFYGVSTNGIVTASQFNQIFKHSWFKDGLQLQKEVVKDYFGFGYMQAPNTIFKNIYQVKPGELISIDRLGNINIKTLISFDEIDLKSHFSENKEDIERLSDSISQSVNRQLVSDVPIACFLSGGIDSPIITAFAKKSKPNIEAFTLQVNDPKLNESEIASAYAKHLNIAQKIISVNDIDLLQSVDAHFEAFSEPFGDYSSIPTFVITREAKKNYTVMLSGDGGDELFYGYPRMLDVLNKRLWFKLPYYLRKPLAKLTNTLNITNSWAPYLKNMDAFVMNKHLHLPKALLNKAFPNQSFTKEIISLYHFKNSSRTALLQQLRWNEFYAHMQRILIKVDRASMKNSLEVRVPFLDKEVIEVAQRITPVLETKEDLKRQLKIILKAQMPDELINKKKMGFSVPLQSWLHGTLRKDVEEFVFNKPIYGHEEMNEVVLQQYVRDFFNQIHSNAWGVWHIYAWQKWAYTHLLND